MNRWGQWGHAYFRSWPCSWTRCDSTLSVLRKSSPQTGHGFVFWWTRLISNIGIKLKDKLITHFVCFLKLIGVGHTLPHTSHVNSFDLSWLFMWFLRTDISLYELPQISHVCLRHSCTICQWRHLYSVSHDKKEHVLSRHLNVKSGCWRLRWAHSSPYVTNGSMSHLLHGNDTTSAPFSSSKPFKCDFFAAFNSRWYSTWRAIRCNWFWYLMAGYWKLQPVTRHFMILLS